MFWRINTVKPLEELNSNDAVLVLRDAIFFDDYILIRNCDNIILTKGDILFIDYYKPSLLNWLLASGICTPGYLRIEAKVKLEEEKKPKRKVYYIKIKYKEVFKLPAKFQPIGWCR